MNTTPWQSAADYYHRLGWWPGVFRSAVWVIASRPVEALDVPEELGRRTLGKLRGQSRPAPVFRAPEPTGTRWVFLTGHRDPTWYDTATTLRTLGVEHLWAGTTLELPPTNVPLGQLIWLVPPVSADLPPFSIVANALCKAGAH